MIERSQQENPEDLIVWREGRWFIAQCLSVDVASQGASAAAAVENLEDALKLHFKEPLANVACRNSKR